ncbi:TPA: amidophosphoribosyltransferase [Candidatus Bathyarchaeota archaeon]|nr:amidophosphoribosyltransferase [Candidatus Bathyarchaeota archaeon]
MYEHCGVIGIFSLEGYNIVPMIVAGLEALQHRGQESWGIATPGMRPFKKLGIVSQFSESVGDKVLRMSADCGIGHVRYSTTAKSTLRNAHPIKIGGSKGFYIAHNGTLEREYLIKVLKRFGVSPPLNLTDTELLGIGLYRQRSKGLEWVESFSSLNPYLNGSFSLVILTAKGELLAARDERGFRPLCLGWHDKTSSYIVASESCALDRLGAKLIRDIQPGEIIIINHEGIKEYRFAKAEKHAHCPFEFTYFAHPSSYIEGINVYFARKNIGKILAEKYTIEGDVVIPVPDSARPAALGYSERSGIPFEEGLMKDRYRRKGSWRSFIEPEKREEVVLNVVSIKEAVKGKRVILIDDSIVRGTSSKIIVKSKLKSAKEVSLLLTFPPIIFPCYAGIDFPTQEELLVYRVCRGLCPLNEINEKVRKEIGVKALGYNDAEGLSKGIGIPVTELCLSCTTGDYSCFRYKPKFKTRKEMKGEQSQVSS